MVLLNTKIMTESEFLLKYGNENVAFSECYKCRMTYKNTELGIVVSGTVEYRDSLNCVETVNEIFQLDNFQFTVL